MENAIHQRNWRFQNSVERNAHIHEALHWVWGTGLHFEWNRQRVLCRLFFCHISWLKEYKIKMCSPVILQFRLKLSIQTQKVYI